MAANTKPEELVLVQIRAEQETLDAATAVFKAMGMNLSTGINLYLKQVVHEGRLPFRPSAVDPLALTRAAAEADVKAGRVEEFKSFAEYKAAMDKL
jgi:DNA-damage-inducible protein J